MKPKPFQSAEDLGFFMVSKRVVLALSILCALSLLCGCRTATVSRPGTSRSSIPAPPPLPPIPRANAKLAPAPVQYVSLRPPLLYAKAPLNIFAVTNGNVVRVFIVASTNQLLPKLVPSPLWPRAHAPRATSLSGPPSGPNWFDAFSYSYFPPDPFAGNYFEAQCDNIPAGTAEIQSSDLQGNWSTIYTTSWSADPTAVLAIVLDMDLPFRFLRLKVSP